MSYRRIFRYLLAGSLLVLVLLWWRSRQDVLVAASSSPYGTTNLLAGLDSGTVLLVLHSPHARDTREEADAIPFMQHIQGLASLSPRDFRFATSPVSQWSTSQGRERPPLMGRFRVEKRINETMFNRFPQDRVSYRVDFPLWLVWLIFAGGAYAFCRFIERRSARRKAQELAIQAADADPP